MPRDICPFCYHEIDRRRLWFACTGNHAPGYRPCQQSINRNRLAETGHEEEMYPVFPPPMRWLRAPFPPAVRWLRAPLTQIPLPRRRLCPYCRGRTGKQVCPCCNTPLPSNFRDEFSPVIAMAGARSTGKTVYLTVLADQLTNVVRRRFDADVTLHGDEGRGWLASNVDQIIHHGRLPAVTQQPEGRSEPLLFEWRRRSSRLGRGHRSSYLSFLDTAGESLGTDRGVDELKFLAKVHAFIILLDPFAIAGLPARIGLPEIAQSNTEALTVVRQVTKVLREEYGVRDRINIPVAVVFAKVDALRPLFEPHHAIFRPESAEPAYDPVAGRSVHQSVRELLLDLGADDIDQAFELNYTNYQYFAVSSLGAPPDYQDNSVEPASIRPVRVSEPLVWLLGHYGLVPTRNDNG